ncbi:hypothetical protein LIA77_08515 [Sarocladium implicatum]|nr:hypothetical protein LIA77_08515 [Sarocladium implicatum]
MHTFAVPACLRPSHLICDFPSPSPRDHRHKFCLVFVFACANDASKYGVVVDAVRGRGIFHCTSPEVHQSPNLTLFFPGSRALVLPFCLDSQSHAASISSSRSHLLPPRPIDIEITLLPSWKLSHHISLDHNGLGYLLCSRAIP